MSQMLYRFINSEHFSDDPFFSVAYLARYADHIGIHHFLCQKLREFSYPEIEFFLPQLCHLLVSIEDTKSVALEEFIFELCEESAHGALLTFWLFQTHLHDLRGQSQTDAFKVCRRIYNKIQHIVFGGGERPRKERLKENVLPVTVLASLLMGAVAAPILPTFFGPLAVAQARKPRVAGTTIDPPPSTKIVRRSKTVTGTSRRRDDGSTVASGSGSRSGATVAVGNSRPGTSHSATAPGTPRTPRALSPAPGESKERQPARKNSAGRRSFSLSRKGSGVEALAPPEMPPSSPSLPDLRTNRHSMGPGTMTASSSSLNRRTKKPLTPALLNKAKRIHYLRSNYFRKETQFLSALEDISNRLVQVPKPARLSALRAELALLNNDLPNEVDIPMICPASILSDGRTSHHRVVRINPAEATVLNSAERVPYLIMVEVLRDDFDFDSTSAENEALLTRILEEEAQGAGMRRIFDLSEAPRDIYRPIDPEEGKPDSVFEPEQGDIGTSPIIGFDGDSYISAGANESQPDPLTAAPHLPRLSSGATTLSTLSSGNPTPRSSGAHQSRSSSPGRKSAGASSSRANDAHDGHPDLTALATHMRTAAHMLAQLEASSSKRPKSEVAAIKAKIIASMQNLEEQSFLMEDNSPPPTFDAIMANATAANTTLPSSSEAGGDPVVAAAGNAPANAEAGAARMENDRMTSGVPRPTGVTDRDDPSAATFGEEWSSKKARIRRSSPYGLYPNWDLLSVIVKTGADLRQEAFACQIIHICGKIWERANVDVWIRNMRILVTGEGSGLIETITNGTSLHSLKRSLTMQEAAAAAASAASSSAPGTPGGTNIPNSANPPPPGRPKGWIASLKDHFLKTFGPPSSPRYAAAIEAFTRSSAAYSILSYILQLKDRHNGNLLIDNEGHIIHIDFGFMLSNVPGGVTFESAPFKLTPEFLELLDLPLYRELCKKAFIALRRKADDLVMLVELMGRGSRMPCFGSGVGYVVRELRGRFVGGLSESEAEAWVDELIRKSAGSYFTKMYDQYQYLSQGIY